eukprot:TRINITY_DN6433_c0_g1_i1.p1 TRINITY_DN6433_c0_g1~~TRINITY_DN6433_c0_g1_i1.p1  ORF type:complete len:192 (+),score=19.90 TRINITY_DN6433_c0_g1_i1:149-724(+)
MLYVIDQSFDDIRDKCIVDLGIGCGILTIGSVMLQSGFNIGIDIDPTALETCKENLTEFEMEEDIKLLECDVSQLSFKDNKFFVDGKSEPLLEIATQVDTVIMNPPFGTKTKGIDMVFLQKAFQIASGAVYSLHKTSTRAHILRKAQELGVQAKVVAELRYDIPQMYKFHKEKSVDIEVDFIRFDVSKMPR